MRKFVIEDRLLILPFNEAAKDLSVLSSGERAAPLALHQAEITESVLGSTPLEMQLASIQDLETELARNRHGLDPNDEVIAYRENLYFDHEFFTYFLDEARRLGKPCQAVLPANDPAWQKYSIPLSSLVLEKDDEGEFYRIDLYYFPRGWATREERVNLRVPSGYSEKGYYNVPDSMSNIKIQSLMESHEIKREQDLTHYLTQRSCVPIQSWVHVFNASIVLGVFSRGNRFEEHLANHNLLSLRILLRAILEQRQVMQSSALVKVGRNCDIDPTAIILGPTTIGDNCKIGPGVIIDNCAIGENVTIANNCHLMLSVVGSNCFLPFRAALFMTMMMENTIVAQNTCLQMCVIGRNSFIGAGTTFTDFNLLPSPLKAIDAYGEMSEVRQPVIGGGVGHNVRIGAGMVIYPARMIESDVILVPSPERRIISKSITYDMSDHITYPRRISSLHHRLYPRRVTMDEEHVLEEW